MILENIYNPVKVPAVIRTDKPGDSAPRINYLREAFADDGESAVAFKEIQRRVIEEWRLTLHRTA